MFDETGCDAVMIGRASMKNPWIYRQIGDRVPDVDEPLLLRSLFDALQERGREGLIVAYGVTEPEAGSNVANLKTVAEPILNDDGTVRAYRIDGTKQFITNGGARYQLVLARS